MLWLGQRKHQIVLCEELALGQAMDMLQDRLRDDDDDDGGGGGGDDFVEV